MKKLPMLFFMICCFFGFTMSSAFADGSTSTVISSTALSMPFHTKSSWYFIISQGPDFAPPLWPTPGPLSLCFKHNPDAVCSQSHVETLEGWQATFPMNPSALPSFLAYSNGVSILPKDKILPFPLLILRLESTDVGPGSPGGPFVFVYRPKLDSFALIFQDSTAHNLNEEIRVVQGGPLSGDIIEAGPCSYPACHYPITVYRLTHNARYIKVLEFRGESRYDDGDTRPVIDADMPEILKRMHAS